MNESGEVVPLDTPADLWELVNFLKANPLKKKKNNSGNLSLVTLSVIKTTVKIICINNGIFLCFKSESIMVSTLPKVLNK